MCQQGKRRLLLRLLLVELLQAENGLGRGLDHFAELDDVAEVAARRGEFARGPGNLLGEYLNGAVSWRCRRR